jgi:septum formation topological specificity factor MinE
VIAHERMGDHDTRTLSELKTEITKFIRNISQVDLHKLFVNEIKRVQTCIDAREHHLQHLY